MSACDPTSASVLLVATSSSAPSSASVKFPLPNSFSAVWNADGKDAKQVQEQVFWEKEEQQEFGDIEL